MDTAERLINEKIAGPGDVPLGSKGLDWAGGGPGGMLGPLPTPAGNEMKELRVDKVEPRVVSIG